MNKFEAFVREMVGLPVIKVDDKTFTVGTYRGPTRQAHHVSVISGGGLGLVRQNQVLELSHKIDKYLK